MNDDGSQTVIELLSFRLADQEYALDIMSVREIRSWTKATPLPHAPVYIVGVINLRGIVLPVMNLSTRLGFETQQQTERNVVIVVQHDEVMVGLLVDAVSDIIALSTDQLQPPPELSSIGGLGVVSALTLIDERMVRILDLSIAVGVSESSAA